MKKAMTPNRGRLQLLFKEIIELIDEEAAGRLIDGYINDRTIVFYIGESSYGHDKKTAFGMELSDDQAWRQLPDAVGPVQ